MNRNRGHRRTWLRTPYVPEMWAEQALGVSKDVHENVQCLRGDDQFTTNTRDTARRSGQGAIVARYLPTHAKCECRLAKF